MRMFNKNQFSEFFATVLYLGKIKYCPGTFGSLVAFPLCYLIVYIIIANQIIFSFTEFTLNEAQLATLFIITLIICIAFFILGTYFTSIYIKYTKKKDPKEVIIDEVVGQMLTIILCSFSVIFINQSNLTKYLNSQAIDIIFLFVLPFSLFRFFDIIKPWPINWLDKNIKGGVGVMLDDVAAGLFASLIHYTISFTLIDWFG